MNVNEIIQDAFDLFDEPITNNQNSRYSQDNLVLVTRIFNRIYADVCKKAQCSRQSYLLSTVSGQREYTLPAWCCGIRKIKYDRYHLGTIFESRAENIGGVPLKYYSYQSGDNIIIGVDPQPAAVYDLVLDGYVKPVADISGDSVPSLVPADYHWVLSYGIVAELMKIDKGDKSGGFLKWSGLYQGGISELKDFIKNGINHDAYPSIG